MADRPETTKSRKAARLGELRAKRIAASATTAAASATIVETTGIPANEDASVVTEPPLELVTAAALPSPTPPEPHASSGTAVVLDPMVSGGGFGGAPSIQAPADDSADISATVCALRGLKNATNTRNMSPLRFAV